MLGLKLSRAPQWRWGWSPLTALTALAAAALLCPVRAQQPAATVPQDPTFRSSVNALTVDVRVTDPKGVFVRDLAADDFRVYEDNVRQAITTFTLVDLPFAPAPIAMFGGEPIRRDVVTNSDGANGRFYVLVLDDAGSDQFATGAIRALGRQFIEQHLDPSDMMAIVTMSGRDDIVRPFTGDRARLLEAVDKFESGYGDPTEPLNTLRFLERIVSYTGTLKTRSKAVVLITNVAALWLTDGDVEERALVRDAQQHLVNAAARGNVNLYSIDPTGNPSSPTLGGIKPAPARPGALSGAESAAEFSGSIPPPPPPNRAMEEGGGRRISARLNLVGRWQGSDNLNVLTEGTGGFSFWNSNDFTAAFDRVVAANSTYYLLTYTSNRPQLDNKLRRIRVEVSRPGLTVRARKGYVARETPSAPAAPPPPGMTAALENMMRSATPVAGLTLQVAGPVFRGTGREANADVIVEARGADLLFTADGRRYNGAMQLAVVAVDNGGRIVSGERGELSMALGEESHDRLITSGVRLLSRLSLKPGAYQLRVGATDAGGGQKFGSTQYDLVVPDFSRGPVSISSVALRAATPDPLITKGITAPWIARLAALPTLRRQFSPEDRIDGYAEIYDNKPDGTHQLTSLTTVQSPTGEVVFTQEQIFTATTTKDPWRTHPLAFSVPPGTLAAGDYVLTVTATRDGDAKRRALQQVALTLR